MVDILKWILKKLRLTRKVRNPVLPRTRILVNQQIMSYGTTNFYRPQFLNSNYNWQDIDTTPMDTLIYHRVSLLGNLKDDAYDLAFAKVTIDIYLEREEARITPTTSKIIEHP